MLTANTRPSYRRNWGSIPHSGLMANDNIQDGWAKWTPRPDPPPKKKNPIQGHGPVGPQGPPGVQGPPGPVTSIGVLHPGDKLIITVTSEDEVMVDRFLKEIREATGLSSEDVIVLINADSVSIMRAPVPDEGEIVDGLLQIQQDIQVIGGKST